MTVRSIVLLIGAVLKYASFTPIGNQVIGCKQVQTVTDGKKQLE